MQEVFGNLWDFPGIHGITTNGFIKRDGSCVMGRGCAKEAAQRFPKLPRQLGDKIKTFGNHVFYFQDYNVVTFPVKHKWWEVADLKLIERSAKEIVSMHMDIDGPVYLPRPGCGNGKLHWSDVKPIIEPIFAGADIRIVSFQGGSQSL